MVKNILQTDHARTRALLPFVGQYATGTGTISAIRRDRQQVFFVVENVSLTSRSRSISVDHFNLARFHWHNWDCQGFEIGSSVKFHGPILPYAGTKFGRKNKLGIPSLCWCKLN